MRDDDQVQRDAAQWLEIGSGNATHAFGMQPAIHENVEVSKLDEQRVGTDAAVAVQVSKLHERAERTNMPRENENEVAAQKALKAQGTIADFIQQPESHKVSWLPGFGINFSRS